MSDKEMENIISKNLKRLISEHNMTQSDLAKIAQVSESAAGKWILGKSTPRMGAIQNIADYFGLPKSYILEEQEYNYVTYQDGIKTEYDVDFTIHFDTKKEMPPAKLVQNISRVRRIPPPKMIKLPVLGKIACGDPITAEENIESYRYEFADNLPIGKLFILIAKGLSMEPKIPDGSYVVVREQQDVENGEIAAVLINGDNEATLKRVKKQGNTIFLMPENKDFDPIIVTEDNPISILGKVVRITTDL